MDWRIATAACRQLGWTWGDLVSNAGSMYGGTSNMVLWNVQFACQSLNSRLVDCPRDQDFYLWDYNNDGGAVPRGYDAYMGVQCHSDLDSEARLVGGSDANEGIVQVLYGGQWVSIYPAHLNYYQQQYGWSWYEAGVVCRMLGWDTGEELMDIPGGIFNRTAAEGPLYTTFYKCNGSESQLIDCDRELQTYQIFSWDIYSYGVAAVRCWNETDDAYEGDLRLVGSNRPGSGTLQIFHDGKWGVMNSTYMDWRIATAACRQLGWTWGDLVSNAGSMYGGTSNMVLWNVQFACQSLNSRLVDCPRDQDFYLWQFEMIGQQHHCRCITDNSTAIPNAFIRKTFRLILLFWCLFGIQVVAFCVFGYGEALVNCQTFTEHSHLPRLVINMSTQRCPHCGREFKELRLHLLRNPYGCKGVSSQRCLAAALPGCKLQEFLRLFKQFPGEAYTPSADTLKGIYNSLWDYHLCVPLTCRTQARDIRQYGMTDLTTTGPKESYVKTLWASYQFTNKKMETIQQQVTSKLNIVTARGAAHDDEYESNCLAEWPASRIIRLHTAGDSAAAGLHCLCAPKGQGGTGTQCQWEGQADSQAVRSSGVIDAAGLPHQGGRGVLALNPKVTKQHIKGSGFSV
ncbi:hypothetical protein VOLCADRAFT_108536 [Volvox carteri f. nagariensis]|uniref:SRCR domain-containing protein n=1 Tax=Volvox carteri f. nagariensis TaxID=3068 RepID=D8UKS1_VOLCA|nr:uncharacterized protein VOLCADRAFT_108536 [Volvox carteri f. nagariensis]EFJ39680.1 hypothetical protein VOLCADRAFT_108536 [Volvox carteri f. nagariensis]|eukprot:XP_002959257.1 hypothetical protein VOLCADRAFT_108536 [Volvox carteri f. nagariensis]